MTFNYRATTTYAHKRGDTLDLAGPINITLDGEPVPSLEGWTGRSQLRAINGALIADLGFEWIDAAQRLCRLRVADTLAWPIAPAEFDIELTSPAGDRVSTPTTRIDIVKDITRG